MIKETKCNTHRCRRQTYFVSVTRNQLHKSYPPFNSVHEFNTKHDIVPTEYHIGLDLADATVKMFEEVSLQSPEIRAFCSEKNNLRMHFV